MSTSGAVLLVLLLSQGAQSKHAQRADQQCKAYTIMREAESENKRSKRAVLDVLQHRMRRLGKSCKAVVSQPHQFSWYRRNIVMKVDRKHLQEFRSVARMKPVVKECAQWFHSGERPSWATKKRLVHAEQRLKFYC